MAIDTIGSIGSLSTNAYTRDATSPRAEQSPDGGATATSALTPRTVAQTGTDTAATSQHKDVNKEELDSALKKISEFIGSRNSDIQFTTDKDTGIDVVKVIDRESKEVIRQIPSEDVLQIAKALDKIQGLLIKQKA